MKNNGQHGSVRTRSLPSRPPDITLSLTPEELMLLTALAADQLFRKEFIDPRMPGHKANPEEICLGKELVGRMRAMLYGPSPHRTGPLHATK